MLGIDTDDATFVDGDTPNRRGERDVRLTLNIYGRERAQARCDQVIEKGKVIASHVLEASAGDIEFDKGDFTIGGTDRSVSIQEIAKIAHTPSRLPDGVEPGLSETSHFQTEAPTFPNGCHICEVEIDPDTGFLEIMKYTVVDDVGVVVNPLTLKGQIHGGVVQGLGQVMMEDLVYDEQNGQLLTGSFMDYAMPRAEDFCLFEVAANEIPTQTNPIGAKGAGEAGTVGSIACAMNAIMDALKPLGIRHIDLPATPQKLWRAIEEARGSLN